MKLGGASVDGAATPLYLFRTKRIKDMEGTRGVQLFHRDARGATWRPAGEPGRERLGRAFTPKYRAGSVEGARSLVRAGLGVTSTIPP